MPSLLGEYRLSSFDVRLSEIFARGMTQVIDDAETAPLSPAAIAAVRQMGIRAYVNFEVADGRTILVVGDLSGKGLEAAVQVATVRNMLRYALYNGRTLSGPMTRLNQTPASNHLLIGFATLFAGSHDRTTGTLRHVNCGRDPALVLRAALGIVETLPPTGAVPGAFPDIEYREASVFLEPGDIIAIFTDGLTEAGPNRREMLGVEGMTRFLQERYGEDDPHPIVERLIAAVDAFARDGLRDDVCLLVGVIGKSVVSDGLSDRWIPRCARERKHFAGRVLCTTMHHPAPRSVRFFALLVLLTTAFGSLVHADETTAPLDERMGTVIPMDYRPPNVSYPVVNLRINGHAPLPFLVDTGTNNFVIQPWAVAALSLTPKTVTSSADGSIRQQIPALKARLEDAAQKRHVDVSVSDARVVDDPILNTAVPGTRLAGIVSFGFLGWSVFRLDFAAKTLTIFPPPNRPISVSGATRVPFELTTEALPAIALPTGAGDVAPLIIDTGSLGCQIPVALGKTLAGARQTDYAFTERAGTLYITPQLHLEDLTLGDLHVSNVAAVALPPGVPSGLGLNVLSRYRVTIDAPHGLLFFEPSLAPSLSWASSGVELNRDKSAWGIARVDAAAPAAKAGLQKGDTILAIDGHDVDGASKHAVQALLCGRTGTTVQVTIQRASGAVQNITFLRAPFTPSLLSLLTGLTLRVVQGGPVNALDVPDGTPAYLAGLRTGDKITAINGKPVTAMDFGQVADAFDAPKLSLSVTRKNVSGPIMVIPEEAL